MQKLPFLVHMRRLKTSLLKLPIINQKFWASASNRIQWFPEIIWYTWLKCGYDLDHFCFFCGLIIEWWGHASGQNVWRPMGSQDPTSLSLKLDIYPLSPLKSMFRQALSVVYCFDLRDRRQKRSYCISLLEISCFKSNGKVAVKESYFAQDQILLSKRG